MLARATVRAGAVTERDSGPGDILASGEVIATLTTVGAGTVLGAAIAAGIVRRTGPVGAFTDTFDSAENILRALGGNDYDTNVLPGTAFRFTYINGVALAMTAAAGTGISLGSNVNVAASAIRTYLLTVLNSSRQVVRNATTTNASAAVTLTDPQPHGTITPGMAVSGTGITAGTYVLGVTYGRTSERDNTDKICAITLSANATATGTADLTFSPRISVDGLFAATA